MSVPLMVALLMRALCLGDELRVGDIEATERASSQQRGSFGEREIRGGTIFGVEGFRKGRDSGKPTKCSFIVSAGF